RAQGASADGAPAPVCCPRVPRESRARQLRCADRRRYARCARGGHRRDARPHRHGVRIVLATAIALVVAIPLDLAIEALARQAFAVSPEFEPFQGSDAPYTAGGIVLAAIAFAVVQRFVSDAARVYVRIAIVVG